jgi:hypothetical protein
VPHMSVSCRVRIRLKRMQETWDSTTKQVRLFLFTGSCCLCLDVPKRGEITWTGFGRLPFRQMEVDRHELLRRKIHERETTKQRETQLVIAATQESSAMAAPDSPDKNRILEMEARERSLQREVKTLRKDLALAKDTIQAFERTCVCRWLQQAWHFSLLRSFESGFCFAWQSNKNCKQRR